MYEFGEQMERVILAAVQTEDGDDTRQSLAELRDLAETAGADAVATVIQNREAVHPATYLGKGKLEEIRELIYDLDATGVICDDELTPAQMNNLEQELECKIMDRTMVILDIFASRASTSEGKIQVELAQLKYRAARLVGMRASLSRLGGGIGTRGPGEKKLEMDRRLIHHRIGQLKEELAQVQKHRDLIRSQRDKSGTKVAAIVGYTNAGKSTLLNLVAGVFPVDSGSISIDGQDVTRLPEHKRAKFIGRVFQDPMMGTAATMQIEENLALAARRGQRRGLRTGISRAEREQYRELLKILDLGLEDRLTSKVGLLSGGQRQALTLLMATLKKPQLLLLDEHTAALDPKTAAKVLSATGGTI